MTSATAWRCPKCYGRNFSIPAPGCRCGWCGYQIPKKEGVMQNVTCANCQHWGQDKPFGAYGIDFCGNKNSTYYNELTNNDHYCKAWEGKENAE